MKWTNVNEELPPIGELVLVFNTEGARLTGRWLLGPNDQVVWTAFFSDGEREMNELAPSHWMPLPAAPDSEATKIADMEPLKQVCTVAQSKRLKELGVNIRPLFWWKYEGSDDAGPKYILDLFEGDYPAYTVAELGEMLPSEYGTLPDEYPEKNKRIYYAVRSSILGSYTPHLLIDYSTEAEARADLLIHLIEQGIVIPEQVNQRLAA